MRERAVCKRKGHKWIETINGWKMPFQFCARMFCDAERPDPDLPWLKLPEK